VDYIYSHDHKKATNVYITTTTTIFETLPLLNYNLVDANCKREGDDGKRPWSTKNK
jgi:hypothetical protein